VLGIIKETVGKTKLSRAKLLNRTISNDRRLVDGFSRKQAALSLFSDLSAKADLPAGKAGFSLSEYNILTSTASVE